MSLGFTCITLFLLLLLSLAQRQVAAEAFIGCADTSSLDNFHFSVPSRPGSSAGTTALDCSFYCASVGFTEVGYVRNGNTATCHCTYTIPAAHGLQYFLPSGRNDGTCPNGQVRIATVNTDFNYGTCYPSLPFSGVLQADGRGLASFTACFTACDHFTYAYVAPLYNAQGPLDVFNCTCSNAPLASFSDQGGCGRNQWFGYTHPVVTPSAFVRKREKMREEMKRRKEEEEVYCPAGLTACRVDSGLFPSSTGPGPGLVSQLEPQDAYSWTAEVGNKEGEVEGSYECLDTTSELESCGGCMFGVYGRSAAIQVANNARGVGVDCSAIPGTSLGGTTCSSGKCRILACEDDYVLDSQGACDLRER